MLSTKEEQQLTWSSAKRGREKRNSLWPPSSSGKPGMILKDKVGIYIGETSDWVGQTYLLSPLFNQIDPTLMPSTNTLKCEVSGIEGSAYT